MSALTKTSVGIIANPAAGRDIRRLVAQASVFPISEKCSMILRILAALGACGVDGVYLMGDRSGIAGRIRRMLENGLQRSDRPQVCFLDVKGEDGPTGTSAAVRMMVEAGVAALIVLGGDGTHRRAAQWSGDLPIATLSTGTNNVFPDPREATIVGLAAGLVATGRLNTREATLQNKVLRIRVNGSEDLALVDACVSRSLWVGSKALWKPEELDQLFVTFAEPDAIGLSSVAGLLCPVSRQAEHGLRLDFQPVGSAPTVVTAPIAPGFIVPVGVGALHLLRPGDPQTLRTGRGVLALDGEREIEFDENDRVVLWLDKGGPRTIQTGKVMEYAARDGLLAARFEKLEGC